MRSAQELLHSLETGNGARRLRVAAAIAMIVALSLLVAWKQFRGPRTEATLEQADVARQLAGGHGFTTLVNHPQTAAVLAKRGHAFDANSAYPELYHAPLYSLVIDGALRLLPSSARDALFAAPAQPADGFGGDTFLLGVNLALLWLAAWLTYRLGSGLFEPRVGWVAALAMLVSVPLWQDTLALNGTPLLMVLVLACFLVWRQLDVTAGADGESTDSGHRGRLLVLAAALGFVCGLLFLAEYSAGALVGVAATSTAIRLRGRAGRWLTVAAVVAAFALTAAPWAARNIALTGNPVALAAQNVALKVGDPTAEPAIVRATLSADRPAVNLRKLGNKTLTSVQENLKTRVWSGGAMWFTAFFAAGWLYAFRSKTVNRLRWAFTAAFGVLLLSQAAFNSGESERLAVVWLAPVVIVFGAGFFFVLLGSNTRLGAWPRTAAAVLLCVQALPLVHDVMAPPPPVRFQYPPYFPKLLRGVRTELEIRNAVGRCGVMSDIPAGVAWYGGIRAWAQPPRLRDFHAISLEQPIGELLLTPRTLDRPFFSELNARAVVPGALSTFGNRFGEWGEIYAGLLTGTMPPGFPLRPQKISENLFVLLNPSLPPPRK
jgi:hypothetical protein